METIKISLGERSYPVYVGYDMLRKLPEMLKIYNKYQQFVAVIDGNLVKYFADILKKAFSDAGFSIEFIPIATGEEAKTLREYERVLTAMTKIGAGRDWALISIGGGVAGDLGGFVAATYMRGIGFIQIPTSLLAQVDASVGGKTAINLLAAKNIVGTFYQPQLVWIDTKLLQTLPEREVLSGFAEVVKYGMILDRQFFAFCEHEFSGILALDAEAVTKAVEGSCRLKAQVVAQDERETGLREVLNFGHTIGHALEAAFGYKRLTHGEAIYWGMLIEAHMSTSYGYLNTAEFARFVRLLKQIPLKASIEGIKLDKIMDKMLLDKKVRSGKIRLVLPKSIGESITESNFETGFLAQALTYALQLGWC